MYQDKQYHLCGYYFSARGLNGPIRFYHEGYEQHEMKGLKRKLFNRATELSERGHKVPRLLFNQLGSFSDTTLDELHAIEDILDAL